MTPIFFALPTYLTYRIWPFTYNKPFDEFSLTSELYDLRKRPKERSLLQLAISYFSSVGCSSSPNLLMGCFDLRYNSFYLIEVTQMRAFVGKGKWCWNIRSNRRSTEWHFYEPALFLPIVFQLNHSLSSGSAQLGKLPPICFSAVVGRTNGRANIDVLMPSPNYQGIFSNFSKKISIGTGREEGMLSFLCLIWQFLSYHLFQKGSRSVEIFSFGFSRPATLPMKVVQQ